MIDEAAALPDALSNVDLMASSMSASRPSSRFAVARAALVTKTVRSWSRDDSYKENNDEANEPSAEDDPSQLIAESLIQCYSGGFGWGLCIRGVGTTNFLVRAVVIDGKERGMTAFARLEAEALGIRLGPSVAGDFHVPSGVADATRHTRLRLVLV